MVYLDGCWCFYFFYLVHYSALLRLLYAVCTVRNLGSTSLAISSELLATSPGSFAQQ